MVRTKEILTGLCAFACAIGIGFVMQKSDAAQARYSDQGETAKPAEMSVMEVGDAGNAMLDVQEITLTSAEYETDATQPAAEAQVIKASAPQTTEPTVAAPAATPVPACEMIATARPIAAAMVELSLQASCLPNERVTVHHNGMIFTENTRQDGTLNVIVPALASEAVFILAFTNGEGAVAQTPVADLGEYDRSVLQWKGNTGFQIHAREFGADYGTQGHRWEETPGEIADVVTGAGGVLTRHGAADAANPLLVEVYTFPRMHNERSGTVALSVETEVTDMNCGLEIEAQSLEIGPDGQIRTQNLTLPVPDCDAKGSFLVLNNLLQDLTVAGR